jgi:hypothetical protein
LSRGKGQERSERVNQHPPRKRRTKAEIERARKKKASARKYQLKTRHHMTPEENEAIQAFQDGVCFICRRAKGITRALSVDHDHILAEEHDHSVELSCELCWRGLLCGSCNELIGHARNSIAFFERCIEYLRDPPAQRWRRKRDGKDPEN